MIKLTITKARNEAVEKYMEWGKELMSVRLNEAVDSLKYEKLLEESAFLLDIEGQSYIAHVSQFQETPLPADMNVEVNKEHKTKNREVMDISVRSEGTLIYDIKAD